MKYNGLRSTAALSIALFIIGAGQPLAANALTCRQVLAENLTHEKTAAEILSETTWDQTIGHGWDSVLRGMNVDPQGVVVEVAPGDRAKVGYGLQGIGFSGTLSLAVRIVVAPRI